MNRKLLLFCLTTISSFFLNAQTPQQLQNYCGTGTPPQQWDDWFNSKVDEYQQKKSGNKGQMVTQVIPVIVHVLYFNEPIGTYPNVDSNQIKAQIAILNADFAGIGANVGNLPAVFAGKVANTGIQFCLAQKDRQDQPLVPHGTDRISLQANTWQNLNTPGLDFKTYMNTVIIPNTWWDPTKYLNIWISDRPPGYTTNGFATYPPNAGVPGVFGGNINIGTMTNDGIWVYTKNFGNAATGAVTPYDLGRTATHEIGHWLGLRHIWGDGNCLSDYCTDTPTQKMAHTGCTTVTPADQCGVGTAPNGEMPMNFMDLSDDACKYMFTHDQNVRMQTALSQSPLRYLLGTHGKCAQPEGPPTASAVASFSTTFSQCLSKPFTPFNMSSGFPYPTYLWSSIPAAVFSPNNTVPNPAITLNNPGIYTISLVATNSLSSSTASFVVSGQFTCGTQSFCLDSVRMIKGLDTLNRYTAPTNTQVSGCGTGSPKGYLVGTNCYKDREFAQFFPPTIYSTTPNPQINSIIVLFDTIGTNSPNSASQVVCKIYGGSGATGPGAIQGSKIETMGTLLSTPAVTDITYLGKPGVEAATNNKVAPNNKFYPFKFDFASPIIISSPASGFFAGIQIPSFPLDSVSILSSTMFNSAIDSSAWFLSANLTWRPFKSNRRSKVQLAILPIITCGPVGLSETFNQFSSNINIMPNPSSGVFNVVFTLPREQFIFLKVYNAMGQLVVSNELKNVMNNMISVDLSDKPDGIYYTEITNGSEKVVRKLVVSH